MEKNIFPEIISACRISVGIDGKWADGKIPRNTMIKQKVAFPIFPVIKLVNWLSIW